MTPDLEARLRNLIDKQDIYEAILRYCRGVDHRDAELIQSAYHPDAHDDHGTFVGGIDTVVVENRAERPGQETLNAMHLVGNCLIELDGDVARAETYFVVYKRLLLDGAQRLRVRAGRYLDVFERRDGSWAIARRTVVDDWNALESLTSTPVGHTPGALVPRGPGLQVPRGTGGQPAPDLPFRKARAD